MAVRKLPIAAHRKRWAIGTAIAIFLVATGIAGIAFARNDVIEPEPWGYLSLMVACLAAVATGILAFAMAYFESSSGPPD